MNLFVLLILTMLGVAFSIVGLAVFAKQERWRLVLLFALAAAIGGLATGALVAELIIASW